MIPKKIFQLQNSLFIIDTKKQLLLHIVNLLLRSIFCFNYNKYCFNELFNCVKIISSRKEIFLLCDLGQIIDRILIFGTRSDFDTLQIRQTPHWFLEGAFEHSTPTFKQPPTIQVLHTDHCMLFIFELLRSLAGA